GAGVADRRDGGFQLVFVFRDAQIDHAVVLHCKLTLTTPGPVRAPPSLAHAWPGEQQTSNKAESASEIVLQPATQSAKNTPSRALGAAPYAHHLGALRQRAMQAPRTR